MYTLEQFPQADVSASSASPTDTTGRGAGPLPLSALISISARPQEQSLHARLFVAQPAPSFDKKKSFVGRETKVGNLRLYIIQYKT